MVHLSGLWEKLRDTWLGAPRLGPLETRVLDVVWRAPGPLTVRDVRAACEGDLAYTTVMTTLDRLFKKGLLRRRRDGRAFAYSPGVGRDELQQRRAAEIVQGLLATGGDAEPVLSALVDGVSRRDRELLDDLERLVRRKREELGPAEDEGGRPGNGSRSRATREDRR